MKQYQEMLNLLQMILILFLQVSLKAKKPFSHYLGKITDKTISDIECFINCIKPNKAIGPNNIPTKILKEFKTELSKQH